MSWIMLLPNTAAAASTVGTVLSQQQIAKQVERTLREAAYLEMTGTVQQFIVDDDESHAVGRAIQPVTFHARMADQRLRTEIYQDGQLILALSLENRRMQEYRPLMPDRPLVEYDAPAAHGTDESIFPADTDGLTRTQSYSWVAIDPQPRDRMDMPASFRQRIERSTQLADATLDGVDHYVFRETIAGRSEETSPTVTDLYVNQQTFLVSRWHTTHQGVTWVRTFDMQVSDLPADEPAWRIVVQPREAEFDHRVVDAELPIDAPAGMTQEEIARRVELTLRNARYLELSGSVQQTVIDGNDSGVLHGLEPVTFHSHMAGDRLRNDVYLHGQHVLSLALSDGRVQEYRPTLANRPLIEYDAPHPHGTGDTIFKSHLDCLTGCQGLSWVATPHIEGHPDRPSYFRKRIESAERLEDDTVNGRDCYVFRETFTLDWDGEEPEVIQQYVFVEKDSYLVLRWDSIVQGIRRERIFSPYLSDTPPADGPQWRIVAPPRRALPSAVGLRQGVEQQQRRRQEAR